MKFKVVLYQSDEGFTVFCPGLNGCITEGDTEEEALENIQSAIREYLEAAWIEAKDRMNKDVEEYGLLNVALGEVDVDTEGVEEAEEIEAVV